MKVALSSKILIKMSTHKCILISGGAGFIGSHVVRRFVERYPDCQIVNLDALTYVGSLENLSDVQNAECYTFEKCDIRDAAAVRRVFEQYRPVGVLHLAAETHVDRSIRAPDAFLNTNVLGTAHLLKAACDLWRGDFSGKRFYHISTDEVYGSLGPTGFFTESTPYNPQSPYSASKAASDHLVRAYGNTYGLPFVISHCSNNYGPKQFPEKLIPLFVHRIQHGKPLPIYGRGDQVRDWLFVADHAAALDCVFHRGENGQTYAIGGDNEWRNLDLVHLLCRLMDEKLGYAPGRSARLIRFVEDRPGHDKRYAIDASKIKRELGWKPVVPFEQGLSQTLDWYLAHEAWVTRIASRVPQPSYIRQPPDAL